MDCWQAGVGYVGYHLHSRCLILSETSGPGGSRSWAVLRTTAEGFQPNDNRSSHGVWFSLHLPLPWSKEGPGRMMPKAACRPFLLFCPGVAGLHGGEAEVPRGGLPRTGRGGTRKGKRMGQWDVWIGVCALAEDSGPGLASARSPDSVRGTGTQQDLRAQWL